MPEWNSELPDQYDPSNHGPRYCLGQIELQHIRRSQCYGATFAMRAGAPRCLLMPCDHLLRRNGNHIVTCRNKTNEACRATASLVKTEAVKNPLRRAVHAA
jgi:hypothetical protein